MLYVLLTGGGGREGREGKGLRCVYYAELGWKLISVKYLIASNIISTEEKDI